MIAFEWNKPNRRWAARTLSTGDCTALDSVAQLVALRGDRCVLFARAGVTVNGLPSLPARVLADRDEIRCSGLTYTFSVESLPEIAPYVAGDAPASCPRCHDALLEGQKAIGCPRCKAVYHEKCWEYDARCTSCGSAAEVWVPDPLNEEKK